jgi:M6 family metalloprotease-like protein
MRRAILIWFFLTASLAGQVTEGPHPCSEAGTLRSPALPTTATQVQFVNSTAADVRVYWIDSAGQRRLYQTLTAGATYTQSTFAAHVWLVTDLGDGCLTLFVAGAGPSSVATVGLPPNPCLLRSTGPFSLGPTDYNDRLRPAGNLNALLLFVDFSDAPGVEDPETIFGSITPPFQQWYADASRGKVTISVTPASKWLRMPKPSSAYSFTRGLTFDLHKTYIADALAAGDVEIDYRPYDIYYILASNTPNISFSPTWVPQPGSGLVFDGKEIRHVVTLGADIRTNLPNYGAWILMHETGHLFGLPDLYDLGTASFPDFHRFVGGWDPMGWLQLGSSFSAWDQFKLLWLDETLMNCVGKGDVEETLTSLTTGSGARGISVPVSANKALIAEVRDRTGVDAGLCDSGVLLYTVDSTIPTGQGPLRVINGGSNRTNGACGILGDATFRPEAGKLSSYTDPSSGVSFTITGNAPQGYKVAVHNPVAVPGAPELLSPVRVVTQDTAPASLLIGGAAGIAFTVSTDSPWLRVSPSQASTPATLTVSIGESLCPGNYTGILTLKSAGGVRQVAVDATISAQAPSADCPSRQ